MKTSREIAEEQIRLQEQIQSAGFNVVSCGRCGCVLIHKEGETEIECFCGRMVIIVTGKPIGRAHV